MGREISIRHTADGTPYARPYLGVSPVTGKQIRPYREFPNMTDAEAAEAAARWVEAIDAAGAADAPKVGEMLARHIDALGVTGASPHTVATYRMYASRYAAPISGMRAREVTPLTVDNLLLTLLTKGPRDGKPLSRTTVAHFKWFLSGAFRRMVLLGVTDANPVSASMTIRPASPEAAIIRDEDLPNLIDALFREIRARDSGPRAIFRKNAALAMLMSLYGGLRVGECCAIRRRDLYRNPVTGNYALIVGGTVVATSTPERRDTTKGHRTRNVTISKSLGDAIGCHEIDQSEYLPVWRKPRQGERRVDGDTPICTTDGRWMNPRAVSARFRMVARDAGIAYPVTFHSLRHTHATYLLTHGTDAKTVAERLGHADAATTLRIYAHAIPARDADAAEAVAEGMKERR